MTPQTPVIIGSMSKAFTALAVMQLAEEGRIELDAPVQGYIPWFTLAEPGASSAITVRHLLNQTSGIPNIAGLAQCLGEGESSIEEQARRLRECAPAYPPGERFSYSNANYNVLGALIEAVTQMAYDEYVQRHIFQPLHMDNSYTSQVEAEAQGMARGYRRWFGLCLPSDPAYLPHALPSGYLISSAEDIAHFLVAHMDGGVYLDKRVLSSQGVAELQAPAADAGDVSYGMGWVVGEVAGVPTVYHHGSTPNFHSTMLIEPEGERGVAVLTNVNLLETWHVGPSSVIAEGVLRMLQGDPAPVGGPTVSDRYLIADLIIAIFTVLFVLSVALLPRWHRRLWAAPPRTAGTFARRVALPMLVDASWPLLILLGMPAFTNVPSWAFWARYQPDFTVWLLVIAVMTLGKAVARLVLAWKTIEGAWQSRRWASVAASIAAEMAFLALFFTAMFATRGPAMFVTGMLSGALALEFIGQPAGWRLHRRAVVAARPVP
jgi:CubicO group peptidase (beta-lactamase class C family)